MKLSVVVPTRDEAGSIRATLRDACGELNRAGIDYEILVVDDGSTDATAALVAELAAEDPRVRLLRSPYEHGFGLTVRAGLEQFRGDGVVIMMADGSDDPADLIRYHDVLAEGYDCAFGSRFVPGSRVEGYPHLKLIVNRIANHVLRVLFRHRYNDTTNAFKAYRREVIETVQPLLSKHFNLTVEIPLKAVVRGHTFKVVPISWRTRISGHSKLGIREMGSRYLFIALYVFLERHLSRGDYRRTSAPDGAAAKDRVA